MKIAKQAGVYLIKHRESGKVYVGSSSDVRKRFIQHRHDLNKGAHCSAHLQAAWNKYGPASFSFEIVETVADTSQLLAREQAWMDALKAADADHGYNTCRVAGKPTYERTPEHRAKISAALKGKPKSAEARAALSAAVRRTLADRIHWLKGRRCPEELRAKLSQLAKERALTEEGKKQNEESVKRLHASNARISDARRKEIMATARSYRWPNRETLTEQ